MGALTVSEAIEHAILMQYRERKISLEEVCERLAVHRSNVWRKLKRIECDGPEGIVHGLRGRPSNFAVPPKIRTAVCDLFRKEYAPFGFRVAHFYQDAVSNFSHPVGYSTVVRWLREEGLVEKAHKGRRHHSRRPRREAFGELIQMDTSLHDWLGWGKNLALISNTDDATSLICGAYLTMTDTTLGNMTVLKQTINAYGLFASLYVDRAPVFKVTRTGGIGRINQPTFASDYRTQIQRALDELGIELIFAYSPQAKGRIERSFGTWQSRLIPELRKNGIRELDKANAYIRQVYVPKHNRLFAKDHRHYPSAFVSLKNINLDFILAERYDLTVSNDHIVSSKQAGISLRILPSKHRLSYAKAPVKVFRHTNGKLSVIYKNERLNFENYG